jgi:hypothetical protein
VNDSPHPNNAARSRVQDKGQPSTLGSSGRYRADVVAGSLKIAESRLIADLLLRGLDELSWKRAITKDNVLKAKNPASAVRLARLSGVNDTLVSARRAEALATIDAQTAEIAKELDAGLKAACLQPVQDLRRQVEHEQSLAHIAQAQAEAVNALDAAISQIEAALKVKAPAQPGKTEPPAPVVKARCVIKPAEIVNKSYLETPDDVEAFIKDLRQRLEAAIANH